MSPIMTLNSGKTTENYRFSPFSRPSRSAVEAEIAFVPEFAACRALATFSPSSSLSTLLLAQAKLLRLQQRDRGGAREAKVSRRGSLSDLARGQSVIDRPLAPLSPLLFASSLLIIFLLCIPSNLALPDLPSTHLQASTRRNADQAFHDVSFTHSNAASIYSRVGNSAVSFTGNAVLDFGMNSTQVLDDGNTLIGSGPNRTTDVYSPLPQRSGFDIRAVYWTYDIASDVMYIGIDCFGVCGDADGDGQPDATSPALAVMAGLDAPALGFGEFFFMAIDTSAPPTSSPLQVEYLLGSPLTVATSKGYSDFELSSVTPLLPFPSTVSQLVAWNSTNASNSPAHGATPPSPQLHAVTPALTKPVDPAWHLAQHANDSNFGDIEFSISQWSLLGTLQWNSSSPDDTTCETGYGTMAFSFVTVLGSTVAGPIGLDFVPNQENGATVAHRVVLTCPWLPLDPMGACCNFTDRDYCGVCHGQNANLDPCGACRLNATSISPSSCPAAVADYSEIDPFTGPYNSSSSSFLTAFDIDGDGIQDTIIGDPSWNMVYIQFMSATGTVNYTNWIDNPNWSDGYENDEFGYAVSPIGDVNSDGTLDLAVGAPGFNETGIVYIFLLDSWGNVLQTGIITADGAPAASTACTAPSSGNTSKRSYSDDVIAQKTASAQDQRSAKHVEIDQDLRARTSRPNLPWKRDDAMVNSDPTSNTPNNNDGDQGTPSSNDQGAPNENTGEPQYAPASSTARLALSPSCSSSSDIEAGSRFGASLVYVDRSILLVSAPGADPQIAGTSFYQYGALVMVALASDGNPIGSRLISTPLSNASLTNTGLWLDSVVSSTIGSQVHLAGVVGTSPYCLISTVHWMLQNGTVIPSLILFNVTNGGLASGTAQVTLPAEPFPLPNYPHAPLLLTSGLLPPNYLPSTYNFTYSLAAAGDVDGDGYPDAIIGARLADGSSSGLVCQGG